jgi:AraC-like DNA-binding protein
VHRSIKGKLVMGLVAVAVAAFAGGAYAATQSSGQDARQAFLNDVAKRLHVTPQQLTSALNGAALDQLQAAVKDGRLTQAEANALEQRLKSNGTLPALPFGLFGPRAFDRPRLPGHGPGPAAAGAGALAGAASYLGLSDMQLFQELAGGKSLAQIATSRGKSVSGLEQAMTAAMKAKLDKAVAANAITAAQEKQLLSRWSARLSTEVNSTGLGLGRNRLFRGPRGVPGDGDVLPWPPNALATPQDAPATPPNAPATPPNAPATPPNAPATPPNAPAAPPATLPVLPNAPAPPSA